MKKLFFPVLALGLVAACTSAPDKQLTKSGLDPEQFKAEYRGDSTALYTLTNANGMEVCITNFGARVVTVMVPDRDGKYTDVVLGFDSIEAYFPETNGTDFGAVIGRYANRIAKGQFVLDGDTVKLPINNYGHSLHGGTDMGTLGWQYRTFAATQPNDTTLELTLTDADGNNGYPGTVEAKVVYTLTSDNTLDIDYTATTDKPTVVNLTNHSYWNLTGSGANTILDHVLTVNADNYTPVDSTFMTTGEIVAVAGTPFDFNTPKPVGQDIEADNEQVLNGHGFDHNWVLRTAGDDSQPAAVLFNPANGIEMTVFTNEPGVQVYAGNFLDGTVTGKEGIPYERRTAICLETQKYPDTPNKPQWPTATLRPGETYHSHCAYHFDVK